jgi:hypothetical protein
MLVEVVKVVSVSRRSGPVVIWVIVRAKRLSMLSGASLRSWRSS